MNTTGTNVPFFKADGRTRILLEDFELGMSENQIKRIRVAWESGADVEDIAAKEKRHFVEVIVALFEESLGGRVKRPFAYRIKKSKVG